MSHTAGSRLITSSVGPITLVAPIGVSAGTLDSSAKPLTLAVIGDTPYGAAQLAAFSALVEDVNGDAKVRTVVHLGDIRTASSPCTTEYLGITAQQFGSLADPSCTRPTTTSGRTATGRGRRL